MKKVWITLAVLVVIIGGLGLVAPTSMHIEREVTINKPKAQVFSYLKSLKNMSVWSPWAKMDPNMKVEYRGVDGAVGSVSAWSGNSKVGQGEQEVKNILDGERIDFELRFEKPMKDTSTAYLITEAVNDTQTKVKWGMSGKSPFPRNIICFVMNMQKKLTASFDEGLTNLKGILEKQN